MVPIVRMIHDNTCVRSILEAGADPQLVNKDGWTPLHLAVRTGDMDIVKLLMEASPGTLEMVSNNMRTVLHTASLAGHEDMVRRILETSPNMVNSQDECCHELFKLFNLFDIWHWNFFKN